MVYCRSKHRSDKDRKKDEHRSSSKHKDKSHHKSSESTDKKEKKPEEKPIEEESKAEEKVITDEAVAKVENIIKQALAAKVVEAPPAIEETELSPKLSPTLSPQVSSTVTIKTPEDKNKEENTDPVVWQGGIDMPDVANFSVKAKGVSGTTDYLTIDLKESLKIVGRIAPPTVWEYIVQIKESPTKEVLLVRLQPTSDDETIDYDSFYAYLHNRNRLGVVGNNSKMVKDCYLMPLADKDEIPSCLLPLEGPGLEKDRPNLLLALIVRTRRKRPGDEKVQKPNYNPKPKDVEDYDPAMAGTLDIGSPDDEEEEIYDPEKAFPDETIAGPKKKKIRVEIVDSKRKKVKVNPVDAEFSGDDESPTSTPLNRDDGPITSTGGGFTEQLAKLTKEIEKQKSEIATIKKSGKDDADDDRPSSNIPGFQGLPTGIASILFGDGSGGEAGTSKDPRNKDAQSSLGKMSDAELLAKAAAQTTNSATPPVMPPPQQPQFSYQPAPGFHPGPHGPHIPPGPPPGPPPMQYPPQDHQFPPPQPVWGHDNFRGPPPQNRGPWMEGYEPQQRWNEGQYRDHDFRRDPPHHRGEWNREYNNARSWNQSRSYHDVDYRNRDRDRRGDRRDGGRRRYDKRDDRRRGDRYDDRDRYDRERDRHDRDRGYRDSGRHGHRSRSKSKSRSRSRSPTPKRDPPKPEAEKSKWKPVTNVATDPDARSISPEELGPLPKKGEASKNLVKDAEAISPASQE